MDRQLLENFYVAAPAQALAHALAEQPLGRESYQFLCERASALTGEQAISLLTAKLADGVEPSPRLVLQRLVGLVVADACRNRDAPSWWTRRVLECAEHVPAEAWLEEVVRPLASEIQPRQWYAYALHARGGELCGPVIKELVESPSFGDWTPEELGLIAPDNRAPNPLILRAIDLAHNDLGLAALGLEALPMRVLLRLREEHPTLIREDRLRAIVHERTGRAGECFATPNDVERLPDWIAPAVAERLRHCEDDEARVLYEWLFSREDGRKLADPHDMAVQRFEQSVRAMSSGDATWRHWCPLIGKHLTTGASWKGKGRDFIRLCIELGKGFPELVLDTSLETTVPADGKNAEEHRASILRHVHDETAKLLVERVERSIDSEAFAEANFYLSAFFCLEPGSFIAGALHCLTKRTGLPDDLRERLEVAASLARTGNRNPSKAAFVNAFHVLMRQVAG